MGKSAVLAVRIVGDAAGAVAALDETSSKMDKMASVASVAGAASGAALAAGFADAVGVDEGLAKLSGQLALTEDEAARIGGVAAELYANGWGESADQINEALHSVIGDIDGMRTASDEALTSTAQGVLTLAQTFDQDLGAATAAVGQMMRTGMAPDAQTALDMITVGLQSNARSSEDLLDTLVEYPALFQRLGLEGDAALGLINQGMAAGARSTDLVADALKEFQIRATDASTSSAEAFAALGLDAQAMTAQIAAGGDGAAAGLDIVLDRLREMSDPVQRNAAAVALFGTQAEDLGDALYALDPSSAVAALGDVAGAAGTLGETVNDTAAASIEAFMRKVQLSFQETAAAAIPYVTPLLDFLSQFAPLLGPLAVVVLALSGAVLVVSGAMKVYAAAQAIQTVAQWAQNAAWLASPITWIVLGVIAAIAAVVAVVWLLASNWDAVTAWISSAWEGLTGFIGTVWQSAVVFPIEAGLAFLGGVFAGIGQRIASDWDAYVVTPLRATAEWLTNSLAAAFEWVGARITNITDGIASGFRTVVGWVQDTISWLRQLASSAVPGWVKDLTGMRFAYDAAPAVSSMPFGLGAMPAGLTFAGPPSLPDSGRAAADEAGTTTINNYDITVNGAVDARSTARQIRDLLTQSGRADGRMTVGGATLA